MTGQERFEAEADSVVCHRCGALMRDGGPTFWLVRIEAFPVPVPPELSEADRERDLHDLLAELCEEAKGYSEQELMDEVYRRLTITLCPRCYASWIERPVG
jgi:Zn-finger nucleic acid-binding protein